MPISRGRVFFLCPYLPYPSARHRRAYLPPRRKTAPRPPKPHRAAFRALCAQSPCPRQYPPAYRIYRPREDDYHKTIYNRALKK